MKKILSVLVMCAVLLATLGVVASAAGYIEQGTTPAATRIKVKRANPTIDGVIKPGEYEEYTGGYTEWFVGEMASEYFAEAEDMAKTARWFFSWDGTYLYIAAMYNAGSGATQSYAPGDYYGDYAYAGTDQFVYADHFLAAGPGLNIVSNEQSPESDQWTRMFYAISEAPSGYLTGAYSGQKGQNGDYAAVGGTDFEFSWNGTWVTVEYRIPLIELNEGFVVDKPAQMFKASITILTGVATPETEANVPTYSWGVRLGQLGYCSDASNTNKGHATFQLVADEVPGGTVVEPPVTDAPTTDAPTTDAPTTDAPTTDAPTTGAPTTDAPVTDAPVTDAPNTDAPATEGGDINGEVVNPGNNNNTNTNNNNNTNTNTNTNTNNNNNTVTRPNNNVNASQTFDFGVAAAIVSAISACGVMVAKKRR